MASVDEETGLLRRRGNTSNRSGGTNLDSQNILSIPATPPRGAVCESLWNRLPYTKEPVPNTGLPCVGTNTNEPCY